MVSVAEPVREKDVQGWYDPMGEVIRIDEMGREDLIVMLLAVPAVKAILDETLWLDAETRMVWGCWLVDVWRVMLVAEEDGLSKKIEMEWLVLVVLA